MPIIQASLSAWLDSESDYRLTVQKTTEAEEGSKYAEKQYEKYNTAYKDARSTADTLKQETASEIASLLDERELIKEIMRMIGL